MSDGTEIIRVLLVGGHELVRLGESLAAEPDIEVVGQAGTTAEALERALEMRPDVALLDVRRPDGSGIEVCRGLKSALPDVACLVMTSFADDEALIGAIAAGAAGCALKDMQGPALADAVRTAAAGGSLLDPAATPQAMTRLRGDDPEAARERLGRLTDSEKRVLALIAEGLSNREIGNRLHLAEKTVKNYVTGILAKLGMRRRTQAAAFALRHLPPER